MAGTTSPYIYLWVSGSLRGPGGICRFGECGADWEAGPNSHQFGYLGARHGFSKPTTTTRARLASRGGHHAAETAVVTSGGDLAFPARADHVPRAVLVGAQERPAAMDALGLVRFGRIERRFGPLRVAGDIFFVGESLVVVGTVPVRTPFPDVPRHVEQAIAIRGKFRPGADVDEAIFARVGSLDRELSLIDVRHPLGAGAEVVSPGIGLAGRAAAGREFPFRFCRQALSRPAAIGDGVVVRHLNHRILFLPLDAAL